MWWRSRVCELFSEQIPNSNSLSGDLYDDEKDVRDKEKEKEKERDRDAHMQIESVTSSSTISTSDGMSLVSTPSRRRRDFSSLLIGEGTYGHVFVLRNRSNINSPARLSSTASASASASPIHASTSSAPPSSSSSSSSSSSASTSASSSTASVSEDSACSTPPTPLGSPAMSVGDSLLADDLVAVKRIRKEKREGFPITAMREIRLLQDLGNHPNIVCLRDVFVYDHDESKTAERKPSPSSQSSSLAVSASRWVLMVFEFHEHDLSGFIESKVSLSAAQIKYYMREILCGLNHLHSHGIVHRDIKGANILVGNKGEVKIADLGLARYMAPPLSRSLFSPHLRSLYYPLTGEGGVTNEFAYSGEYTNRVVTLWYRPPECLLGLTNYTTKVDVWSAACLFAELLCSGAVLFAGNNSELDQLNKIYDLCGTCDQAQWNDGLQAEFLKHFTPKSKPRTLRTALASRHPHLTPQVIDLLDGMLQVDPARRLSAAACLQHPFFHAELPAVMPKSFHPVYQYFYHEYFSKKKRRAARAKEKKDKEKEKEKEKTGDREKDKEKNRSGNDIEREHTAKKRRSSASTPDR